MTLGFSKGQVHGFTNTFSGVAGGGGGEYGAPPSNAPPKN